MKANHSDLFQPSIAGKREKIGHLSVSLCAWLIICLVIMVLGFTAFKGTALFRQQQASLSAFLTGVHWLPNQAKFGILPLLSGSLIVAAASLLLAVPFALGTAIFMTEVAEQRWQRLFRGGLSILSGIPAVVYGLVGIVAIIPLLRTYLGGTGYGWLAAAIILAIMILPTLITLAADAFAAVPRDYQITATALGATKFQVWLTLILPLAVVRLKTALIFGFAQAFGEAVAVQMVIGNAALLPTKLNSPAATLTSVITINLGDTAMGSNENNALWSLALVLLLMSLLFNLLTHYLMRGKKDID
ncbi:phosphate ABC transporter permease [Liquorilactobacillus ghanensis DSM 18630]|uniref:Phosphate transport system permease protein n=1 Tax=Liquorilactobacillus ghanensis DSM 18630 TaxID=1423750 RepID=A0A0R1VLP6_9LACO|nr:phosphate ABC transporter permease subunit PstC [Liquorilactobacillus ghanensis]KRM06567.1 phosphate ABC transporter permease [Liquorilactobacillus ghanensis DSM 18630]